MTCRGPADAKPRSPQVGPTSPETTQRGPKTTQRGPETTQRGPETTQRGPETTQRGPETTQRGPDHPESTPVGPGRPGFDPAVPGPSRRRSFDSPQRSSDHSSRQGGQTPLRKRRRLSGNSSDEDPSSQNRQQRDDQQDKDDNFRPASLDLLLNYINKKFPAASQYLVQPSSKWSHALLFPVFHQGKSLGEGVPRSSPQGSHKTGSLDSRLLQSPIRGPEGLWVLATHHRPVYPEHIHCVTTLPYGDSSVRPTLHSPR